MTFRRRWLPYVLGRYALHVVQAFMLLAVFGWSGGWLTTWRATVIIAVLGTVPITALYLASRSWLVRTSDQGLDLMMRAAVHVPWEAVQATEVTDRELRVQLRPAPVIRYIWSGGRPKRQPSDELQVSLRLLDPARRAELRQEIDRHLAPQT